ncbi:MAG: rod shape-determining protein RodA [Deltaproteobacteria bacterium]|nr:MAG: rod shape-determining protein RodA [Deltaproteobacteria bacterium]
MTRLGLARATVGRPWWLRFASRFDWPLFCTTVLIAGIGLLNLHSALSGTRHEALFARQVAWMLAGAIAFFAMTAIDYRFWERFAWFLLGGAIVAVALVYVAGVSVKGAQRWLGVAGVTVQPSELAKIAVIVALAQFAQEAEGGQLTRRQIAVRVAALAAPVGLIVAQPDLGSAVLVALIVLSVAYFTVSDLWRIHAVVIAGLAALPLLWERMETYQRNRVLCFLDPESDPTGLCWHTKQSIIAVGSGRILGEGYMNGTQNQFKFLPEHWTDFPFSVFAEEWGFVGGVVLLALFAFLILWIVNAALHARDRFGAVLCLGVAAMLFWHTAVNVAMVLGLAPVVGVTLPLVSYGGSSVMTVFLGLGLVSSVSARRHGF